MSNSYVGEVFLSLSNDMYKVIGEHSTFRGKYISYVPFKKPTKYTRELPYSTILRKEYEIMFVFGNWRLMTKSDILLYG